jgi:glycosyltransferase involved in cell wall biosynthesis
MTVTTNKSILLISNLYPNCNETTRGLFIKQLTESFAKQTTVTVIAPLPFNPKELVIRKNRVPKQEVIDGITVYHPRYVVIPKLFRSLTGYFFYSGIKKLVGRLVKKGLADVISAHWVYPDGFGAVQAAKHFGKPIAVHGLGCDINEYTKFQRRKRLITQTLNDSDINIVKSQELKNKITALGVEAAKTFVIHNGVDQKKFVKRNVKEVRQQLDLETEQKYLLFVGNFQIEKGLVHLINAVSLIKEQSLTLLIIGSGPLQDEMVELVKQLNIEDKVIFLGRKEHQEIPLYLAAADLLCLPSLREGCPNVVLESLSCGTPVVASRVGAVPDILTNDTFGVMVEAEDPKALADGVVKGLQIDKTTMPDFNWYDWSENADKILEHLNKL